jgi:nucleoside-diphosphate-sugar epimerase
MAAKKKILIVGFGDVGVRLARLLIRQYRVYALVRKPESAALARAIGVTPIPGDLADHRSLARLAGLASAVFHFAPPPSVGRVDVHTRNLLAALSGTCGRMLTQRLIYISTTGVYGDCGGNAIDETQPTRPATARAVRRVDAESRLRGWGARNHVAVAILRAPGIYAQDRMPVERLQRATPALNDTDDVFTNHIHADDLARVALAAMRAPPNRLYNVVDDSEMKMGAYFDLVADHFHLPRPPRVSRADAAATISPAMFSFMSESRRIGNARMKRELKVKLSYSSVGAFLATLQAR